MLLEQEMVSHAGDVIADHTVPGFALRLNGVLFRHGFRVFQIMLEELRQGGHRAFALYDDGRMIVETPG